MNLTMQLDSATTLPKISAMAITALQLTFTSYIRGVAVVL